MKLPIRRAQFKTAEFAAWLAQQGAEVGTPTNPYEVVRYRAYVIGGAKPATHIVYAKESGLLNFVGETRAHYEAFMAGEKFAGMFVSQLDPAPSNDGTAVPRNVKKPSRGEITRDGLLLRDGEGCWFCGKSMGDDSTIEHLVPRSKGGVNHSDNYVLAHRKCNSDAANMPLVEKLAMRQRLRGEMA